MTNTDIDGKKPETRQVQLYEGDGLMILPESERFSFKCCSCGLVHRIEIEHTGEGTILRFYEEA
jgi:hypothetical protein